MQAPTKRFATLAALLIAAVVTGVTTRFNIFVPWGTDSSAYIDAAHRWADGDLFKPATFLFWAPWSANGAVEAPLGQIPGPIRGTLVSAYPLGYPLLMAAALKLAGPLAPYIVAPLFAGLLSWCTFVLGSQLSRPWAGVAASFLIAVSPITLANAVSPMSDVPAAALWALSWVLSLRPGLGAAGASGLTAAIAIMVRPNLAPLAIGIAAIVVVQGMARSRWARSIVFGSAAAIGPAMILWSQAVLYGSPFSPGYRNVGDFFSADRVVSNLALYPHLLVDLHGWLVLAGLVIVPLALLGEPKYSRRATVIAIAALGIVVINYTLYLPYLTYQGWPWLRFMLPALFALFILFAASVDRLSLLLPAGSRLLPALMAIPILAVAVHPHDEIRQIFGGLPAYRRVQLMGDYLRQALPPNAVVLTYLQSGAAALYTGRPIIRLDAIKSTSLDIVVQDLVRHGYRPVFVIDDAMESDGFRERFSSSRYHQLDWLPRAEFFSGTSIMYLDSADRDSFLNGERWPMDILTWPIDASYSRSTVLARAPLEILLPSTPESLMFRRALDNKYKDGLHRPASSSYVDLEGSVIWTRRYLRYRLHGCAHGDAVGRVFAQIDGYGVEPVCAAPSGMFPPRDELVAFRRRLEEKYRDELRKTPSPTHVDLEGDAIWTGEYLRYRVGSCSHRQASDRVFQQIDAGRIQPTC